MNTLRNSLADRARDVALTTVLVPADPRIVETLAGLVVELAEEVQRLDDQVDLLHRRTGDHRDRRDR